MAGAISAANIRLGADITGLLAGLRSATQAVSQHTDGINRGLTQAYRQADTAARTFRGGIGRLGSELQDIGQKMAVFGTLPALFAAGTAFKGFADLQKLTIGLNQYGETLQTVQELAKLPNVGIEGAAQSLIQLRAVGVESELAQKGIKAFANALTAAGKSSVDLNPALTNVVQMLSTGVVSAADVKELANRIPQTRKALMDAFGTAKGEDLTKIGPEKVITQLIEELGKIPPVAGGAGMAMEKFGDSSQIALATVGESIDKAFGLTKAISDMADGLQDAATTFSEFAPETQKLALSFTALAAATPILIAAVGAIVSAGSALAVGLGVAGGTVAAVAAAVVLGGTLIVTYWDDIKRTLINTGFWTTFSSLAESSLDVIVSAFKAVGSLLTGDWSALWTNLRNIVAGAINFLNAVMFGLVKQVGLVVGSLTSLIGMDSLGKWIREKAHGLDGILKQLKITEARVAGQSVVSTSEYGKQFADDDRESKAWEAQQERLKKTKPVANIAALSIKELGERLTSLKEAYETLKPGEEGYLQTKASIAKQVRQVTNLIDVQGKALADSSKHYTSAGKEVKKLTELQYILWRTDLESKVYKDIKAVKDATKEYKSLVGVVAQLNVEKLKGKPMNFEDDSLDKLKLRKVSDQINSIGSIQAKPDALQQMKDAIEDTKPDFSYFNGANLSQITKFFEAIPKAVGESAKEYALKLTLIADATKNLEVQIGQALSGMDIAKFFKEWPQKASEALDSYRERIAQNINALADLNRAMTAAIQEALVNTGVAFGELVGDALSGVEDPLKNLGKTIFGILGNLLSQLGKALITYSTVIEGLKTAIKSMNGYVALAAGVLAIAAGKALMNSATKSSSAVRFAKGGFAYGEMSAIVGDNPNARFDPEMIAPYSKVDQSIKRSIAESGIGGSLVIPEMRLRGEDIYIAFKRAEQSNRALKGR